MATLKAVKDRATLVIQKSQHYIESGTLSNLTSQSTGAVNHIGHSMVDSGRSLSPIPPTSRPHSPPMSCKFYFFLFSANHGKEIG